ncbi:T9SS type A sorting domain-containing protein [Carboxylicivirga sp. A043]|uniref:type IX secretion system anionic LPS delivery protein PorZ n=1 Tax=Carboxylicivirga litoralis TaxID=2816963 RepID=UPI0021CAF4E9|nr:two-component regulator propeller domain-containing protein [Carboxylicivirga sp. A043]MCU4155207.1 T9SS type A sorting domain-containing protein [Carboxylicivirga sp. A043]
MLKSTLSILFCFVLIINVSAQDSRWRDHFSYRNAMNVAESDSYVAASGEMGLMLFNKLNKEIATFSRVNGLSDVDITALQSFNNDAFIIGYANGNIDVVSEGGVYNIPDFKLKQIQGSKQINHFYRSEDKLYCSTDYALLVIDIEKKEISDTYFLGYNAESLKIYETVILGEYIYAATERGLLRSELSNPLIVYDKAWTLVSDTTLDHVAVNVHNGQVVSVVKKTNTYDVFYGQPEQWSNLKTGINWFESLDVFGGKMVLSYQLQVELFDELFVRDELIDKYSFDEQLAAQDAIYSGFEDAVFIADKNFGLVKVGNASEDLNYVANGPYSNNCFDLHATSTGVYSTAGGITATYNNLNKTIEYSYFDYKEWGNYISGTKASSSTSRDLLRICSSQTSDTVYMCSWGGGIYEIEGTKSIKHYDETNSALEDIYPDSRKYVRVGGIASDSEGNIWMSNGYAEKGMVVKTGSSWNQLDYEVMNYLHSTGQILITKNDEIWIPAPMSWLEDRQGIIVIDTNGTLLDNSDDQYKCGLSSSDDPLYKGQLQLWDENRNVITKVVLSMAEDKNGYIWLGTDKGVLVYYRPWAIFSEDYPVASRIKVPRNDGSNLADYLLEDERVSCIAVDGANRKWIGTENSGLYLVSEDGLKTYHTFNTNNSPLPSNSITSIAILPVTGEVFIGTAKGIVSYKAKAIEGEGSFNKVYAYPNPVRNDFIGEITITGLMENSIVKITSISGKLVHETTSLGGKAYWDGTNFKGEKVKTGVYLVYASGEDAAQSAVAKILIVR